MQVTIEKMQLNSPIEKTNFQLGYLLIKRAEEVTDYYYHLITERLQEE